jgi:hypothetical protein
MIPIEVHAHKQLVRPFRVFWPNTTDIYRKLSACLHNIPIYQCGGISQLNILKGRPPNYRFVSRLSEAHLILNNVRKPVRLILATCNAVALVVFRRAVSTRFGCRTASIFTLLTCTQFHLLFWMGRTLPNMFALPLGASLLL